jgi:ATP adenylyltransferase
MPVVNDTKVIVEAIEDTYDRLHDAFASQDGVHEPDPDEAIVVE